MRSAAVWQLLAVVGALVAGPACRADDGEKEATDLGKGGRTMEFAMKSSAFDHEGSIPKKYTCDGPDLSPALSWGDPPEGTVTLALVMDDPDAPGGTWVHWVLYDLPVSARELNEGVPDDKELGRGTRQGRNDFRRIGYGGPCPPPGAPHRYLFKLYALDRTLSLEPGATKAQVERAMEGHVLARAELMGRYGR
jgi:Raf kinase inhibitor-like YbhB/YbcL family protein